MFYEKTVYDKINDLSKMKQLEVIAKKCDNIHNLGIHGLNLRELYIDGNHNVTDVSFMTNLKILSVSDSRNSVIRVSKVSFGRIIL